MLCKQISKAVELTRLPNQLITKPENSDEEALTQKEHDFREVVILGCDEYSDIQIF